MLVTSLYPDDWQHGVRYFVKRRADAKPFILCPGTPLRVLRSYPLLDFIGSGDGNFIGSCEPASFRVLNDLLSRTRR